jgi:hypothetical protein
MTATEQGAYCKSCQKNVIDFTTKTENEIYEILTQTRASLCGRFTNFQLAQPIRKTEIQRSFFNWKALAASLIAFIATGRISANGNNDTKPKTVQEQKNIPDTTAVNKQPEACFTVRKKMVIRSRVLDKETYEPVALATVRLKNAPINDVTDIDGTFVLGFDKSDLEKYGDSIEVVAAGYLVETVPIDELLSGRQQSISLSPSRLVKVTSLDIVGIISLSPEWPTIDVNRQEAIPPPRDLNGIITDFELTPHHPVKLKDD